MLVDYAFPDFQDSMPEDIRRAIESDFYRDNSLIVIGLPKSGSKSLTQAAAYLILGEARGKLAAPLEAALQGGMVRSLSITLSLLLDTHMRGAWHGHPPYSHTSAELLRTLRIPSILLFRHPLDHLVAMICHWRKPAMLRVLERYRAAGCDFVNTAIAPVPLNPLDKGFAVSDSVERLIRSGYLVDVLTWLFSWARGSDRRTAVLTRLEDLLTDPRSAFERIARGLFGGEDFMGAVRDAVRSFEASYANRHTRATPNQYPGGWTGRRMLWKDYCSDNAVRVYNEVTERFLGLVGVPPTLAKAAPDLLIARQ